MSESDRTPDSGRGPRCHRACRGSREARAAALAHEPARSADPGQAGADDDHVEILHTGPTGTVRRGGVSVWHPLVLAAWPDGAALNGSRSGFREGSLSRGWMRPLGRPSGTLLAEEPVQA